MSTVLALCKRLSSTLVHMVPATTHRCRWQAHAAGLLELFSAQGVLVEVVERQQQVRVRGLGWSKQPSTHGTLSGMGYAPKRPLPGGTIGSSSSSGATGSSDKPNATPDAARPCWMERVGWCTADGRLKAAPDLAVLPIEPVVSPRLVSSQSERSVVLEYLTKTTGLRGLEAGGLPVATHSVNTLAEARWVGMPGQYMVARKCDGTRRLLLVFQNGVSYLLNRAGALYKYPIAEMAAASESAVPEKQRGN